MEDNEDLNPPHPEDWDIDDPDGLIEEIESDADSEEIDSDPEETKIEIIKSEGGYYWRQR